LRATDLRQHSLRPYAEWFQGEAKAAAYERFYKANTYDAFIWELQRSRLEAVIAGLRRGDSKLKHLDFACGTGRIISAIHGLVDGSTGVDVSQNMLTMARLNCPSAVLKHGDIIKSPGLVDADYDVITAFRFFLNAEPQVRQAVMLNLASRLRTADSRLIFNVHEHARSYVGLKRLLFPHRYGSQRTMSRAEAVALVENAGLEVETWYGFGICPRRLYSTPLGFIMQEVDRWAAQHLAPRSISWDLLFVCRPVRHGIARDVR
jgi:SAM-dependent methyltransferase